ncbi:restriction endonuclease subunit S [Vibrio cholerae]|uniref:restriction endonuclease subunit S n=1 Tax=Vibrio cholerae TaxID=666 RepID=UPI0011DBFC0E|nr:restriction endonuclease subunit S [Vibrio cholerae]EGR1136935.1 restriction endonuclease subunit S [Vibrio cholerae]EJB8581603.1 restriction endonuclease subunit S [Vibrio cholerae]TXZ01621.1 restriction endonuclease subunit S [Vibrio cholerae]GHW43122.1 Type I restriction-modification system, specificity subunit S [Vibrio cholerae]GHX16021.1 Type I restriction-modification system, specificity subunit S [Vibrio cholerae]
MTEQQLPEGWQMVKFGDIAKHISKRVEPSETDLEIYVGLEHLDPDSLKIKRHGVPSDVEGQKLLVKKGQIIFGKRRAYQRKVAVADWDCICSAHAMVLEANPKNVLPEFLPFFMQSDVFMERAVAISEGSLSPTIKWKVLANQDFLFPSKKKQEQLLGSLRAIKFNKHKIEETKRSLSILKKSMQNNVFDGHEMTSIGSIATVKTGATPRRGISEFWDGDISWMASGEVHQKFLRKTAESITKEGLAGSNTSLLPKNTVVLAMNGQGKTRGTVAITEIETTCNQSIAAIIFNEENSNPLFMMFYLEGQYEEIRALTGEGRNGLNLKIVRSIPVPKIPKAEQDKLAQIFLQIYNSEQMLNEKVIQLNQLSRTLIKE